MRITVLLALSIGIAGAQSTSLTMRVVPEARLSQPSASLHFEITGDPTRDLTSQAVTLTAMARTSQGGIARVMVRRAGDLELRFDAAKIGGPASCAGGTLDRAGTQELSQNWTRSGTLTCTFTFHLANAAKLPPGTYRTTVSFEISAN